MRVWCLKDGFGFDHLALEERAVPSCGPRQVLVRVHAVSLNARDVMVVQGAYNPRQRLPLVVCSDAAGEVVERGAEVSEWAIGDRVCPIFAGLWREGALTREAQRSALGAALDGTLSEYLVLDEHAIVSVPPHLSMVEAACLPCAAVTAYRAMIELGGMQAGNWLLCQGSGGVSLAGLGIAKALGMKVIVTSRSQHKLRRSVALGADHVVDTTLAPDFGAAVRTLVSEGVHHVLEVGGARTVEQSVRALRLGGTLSVIGVLSGAKPEFDLRPLLMQDLRVQGVFVGSRATFLALLRLYTEHTLRPQVDRVFDFEDSRAAFEHAASGDQFGKVVISVA